MAYEIALHPASVCDAVARKAAETHYRHALELIFGGEQEVCAALLQWETVQDVPCHQLTEEQGLHARTWMVAAHRARVSGLASLPADTRAEFIVRLRE